MKTLLAVCAIAAMVQISPGQTQLPAAKALSQSTQLLVVTTLDWTTIHGVLRCYERDQDSDEWEPVSPPIPVVVGRTGLAWGRGLWEVASGATPIKHEGDGKAPAGVFTLGTAFGYEPPSAMPALSYPYSQMDSTCKCVDDSLSHFYNEIVRKDQVSSVDWTSAEEMKRRDELYHLGVVVNHNVDPKVPAGGSCIFLHIDHPDGSATTGCTAMNEAKLRTLVTWLNAEAHPLLVQMPEEEYSAAAHLLALPVLTQ